MIRCELRTWTRLFFAGFLFSFVLLGNLANAQQIDSTLPPEAKKAMTRGMAAAKQADWNLAIKYFKEAQKRLPSDPRVLFNLALANDKSENREMIAIPWYQAYLAAAPDASNREAVKKRIIELDVSLESRIRKLLVWGHSVVDQLTDGRASMYGKIALAQYEIGDLSGAMGTLRKMPIDSWASEETYQALAVSQIQKGNLEGAEKTIKLIKGNTYGFKVSAFISLAEAQFQQGNREAAYRSLSLAHDSEEKMSRVRNIIYRNSSYMDLAKCHAKMGDKKSAKESFKKAKGTIDLTKWPSDYLDNNMMHASSYEDHASKQAEVGYIDDARKTFKKAIKTARLIKKDDTRSRIYAEIAIAQAKAGDKKAASKTLLLAKKDYWIQLAKKEFSWDRSEDEKAAPLILKEIAVAEARIFDIALANKTIDNISYRTYKGEAYLGIVRIQLEQGDIEGAKATAGLISDDNRVKKSEAYLDIVRAQLDQGDIAGARKTARLICAHDCYQWQLDRHVDTGFKYIIQAQAKNGNFKQARETAGLMNENRNRLQMYKEIADIQVMTGGVPKSEIEEEVSFWTCLAKRNSEIDFLNNFGGYLKSIKGQKPKDIGEDIIKALNAMINSLKEIRQMKVYWGK